MRRARRRTLGPHCNAFDMTRSVGHHIKPGGAGAGHGRRVTLHGASEHWCLSGLVGQNVLRGCCGHGLRVTLQLGVPVVTVLALAATATTSASIVNRAAATALLSPHGILY
eukprot:COSAG06_NODE_18597_length_878_cov_1.240051_1_plen_111_part_00